MDTQISAFLHGEFSQFLKQWAFVFWQTFQECAPFLTLGLILAGVLHVLIPARWVSWTLGVEGWRGVLRGALVGVPLPLCSCGVIPTSLALKRQGASKSATTAFTVSTPETSIDAIALTAALLPALFFGARPLAALLLALAVGLVVNLFSSSKNEELRMNVLKFSRHDETHKVPVGVRDMNEICRVCGLVDRERQRGFFHALKEVVHYAFGAFFRNVAGGLFLGIALGALMTFLVPDAYFSTAWWGANPEIQIALAVLIGIPLYSCAAATTPMAAVLLAKGVDPGAILTFLLAGTATNVGNFFVLKGELGVRTTAVYYAALVSFCFLLGFAFNKLSLPQGERLSTYLPQWLGTLASVFLFALAAKVFIEFLIRKNDSKKGMAA